MERRGEFAAASLQTESYLERTTSAAMTALYTGEVPLEDVQAEFSSKFGNKIVVLENMENKPTA
jgi:hypothetical protein